MSGFYAHSIASGSSGNSILVGTPKTCILIDAGISCRRLEGSLLSIRRSPSDISAILLTHEHSDHVQGVQLFARKHRVPVISTESTLSCVVNGTEPHRPLQPGEGMSLDDLHIECFSVPHDAADPVGYSLFCGPHKICVVTDAGHATPALRRELSDADLLILESNHDVNRLLTGPYPRFLKQRIISDHGHLSNDAAGDLLIERAKQSKHAVAWLAHLSKTNNSPTLALKSARARLVAAGVDSVTVDVALRDKPSVSWRANDRPFQISLAF